MNKISKNIFSLILILSTSLTLANEVKLASGNLYELPYLDQEKIYLELDYPQDHLQDPDTIRALDLECSSIKNFLRRTNLTNQVAKDSYNSLRKSPFRREISYNTFAVRFRINLKRTQENLIQSSLMANNALTQYNFDQVRQEKSSITMSSSNFSVVNAAPDSLTSIASKAGIQPLPIEMARGTNYPGFEVGDRIVSFPVSVEDDYLKIYIRGRDTFCDLMAQKISIQANANGTYFPNQDDLSKVSDFYNQSIAPAVEKIFKDKKSIIGRSALVGHKFGELIKNQSEIHLEENQVITKISTLVDSLFNPTTFERNNVWERNENGYQIILPISLSAPVTVSFEVGK